MIAKNIIVFVMLIVVPYLWTDYRFIRPRHIAAGRRLLIWLPCFAMLVYTVALATCPHFIPRNRFWIDMYLVMLGLLPGLLLVVSMGLLVLKVVLQRILELSLYK